VLPHHAKEFLTDSLQDNRLAALAVSVVEPVSFTEVIELAAEARAIQKMTALAASAATTPKAAAEL